MQGRIQRKYIWVSSIVLTVIVIVLLTAVNAAFSARAERKTADILSVVMKYGADPAAAADDLASDEAAELAQASAETPYSVLRLTNYFLADVTDSAVSENTGLYMDGAVELTREEALALVEAARISERASGRVGQFAFQCEREADGAVRYAFANVGSTMLQAVQLGSISFGMGAVAVGAVFLYVWGSVMGFLQPLERRTDEGARLMAQAAQTIESQPDPGPALKSTAQGLAAASEVLEGRAAKQQAVPLSIVLAAQCEEAAQAAAERGGTLETDIQDGVSVRGDLAQLRSLCRLLLMDAVRAMRADGSVRADLFADGGRAGLVVRATTEPFSEEDAPEGDDLAAVRLIARNNGGRAAFEAIAPDTQCYTVTWATANRAR